MACAWAIIVFQWSISLSTAEREAKCFVVGWLTAFKADEQEWSENRPDLLFWHPFCFVGYKGPPFIHLCDLFFHLFSFNSFLCLLQAWADAFRSSPDLTGVVQVYEELKRKGIEFPMSELETLSPIHTPLRVGGISLSSLNPLICEV